MASEQLAFPFAPIGVARASPPPSRSATARGGRMAYFRLEVAEPAAVAAHGFALACLDACGPRCRLVEPARLHVSLAGCPVPDEALETPLTRRMAQAAETVAAPAFDVRFDRPMLFGRGGGDRPLVLVGGGGMAEIAALQRLVAEALRGAGLLRNLRRSFVPHVTLAYRAAALPGLTPPPVAWRVRDFTLVRGGDRQAPVELGRWLLGR